MSALTRFTRPLLGALLVLASSMLAACGTSPTTMAVSFETSSQLNMNSDNQASPAVVRLYDLKSAETFNGLSFFDLFDADSAKLGGDLLGKRQLEIQPGDDRVESWQAPDGTKFLGVIVGYRDPDGNGWRAITPVAVNKKNALTLALEPRSAGFVAPKHRFLGLF